MVLEYCSGGDLLKEQATKANKVFKLGEAVEVLKEVIMGLEFLHGENYLHRDIKPQNILVKVEENNKKVQKSPKKDIQVGRLRILQARLKQQRNSAWHSRIHGTRNIS